MIRKRHGMINLISLSLSHDQWIYDIFRSFSRTFFLCLGRESEAKTCHSSKPKVATGYEQVIRHGELAYFFLITKKCVTTL